MIKPKILYGYIICGSDLYFPYNIKDTTVGRETYDEFFTSKKEMLKAAYQSYKNAFDRLNLKPESYQEYYNNPLLQEAYDTYEEYQASIKKTGKPDRLVDDNGDLMLTKKEFKKNWPEPLVIQSAYDHISIEFTTIVI